MPALCPAPLIAGRGIPGTHTSPQPQKDMGEMV